MNQYRISVQIDIFIEAESMEEAHKIWVRNTKIEVSDTDDAGKDHDWEITNCKIDSI
jgi:hypothetical protein